MDFITRRYCKWTRIDHPFLTLTLTLALTRLSVSSLTLNPNPIVIKCRVIKCLVMKCLYTLCITSQESSFEAVERNLTDSLTLLTEYCAKNHLKPNASKTQVCAFHLRNREANRPLRVTWSGTPLEYHPNLLYLGVKLDRTLSYRSHILSTKAKVNTRNNILRKLTNSKWGCTPHTLRTSTLAL